MKDDRPNILFVMADQMTLGVMVAGLALVGPGDFTVRKLMTRGDDAVAQEA